MQVNAIPKYDTSINTTGCCAKFNPEGWDGQRLRFRDKPFILARTKSVMHIPVNMGRVFTRVLGKIGGENAEFPDDFIVLSRDTSAWEAEHLFSTAKDIEGEEKTTLSGDFVTKVFEGPYRDAKHWYQQMQDQVRDLGSEPTDIYFFYTTCPKCAKAYGQNYVIGVARV